MNKEVLTANSVYRCSFDPSWRQVIVTVDNGQVCLTPDQLCCHWKCIYFFFIFQRAQEEVHSKELKVKLLTDSVNSFIAKAPPTAHDALRSELDVLTANYNRLCSRLDGKCKTLEV